MDHYQLHLRIRDSVRKAVLDIEMTQTTFFQAYCASLLPRVMLRNNSN